MGGDVANSSGKRKPQLVRGGDFTGSPRDIVEISKTLYMIALVAALAFLFVVVGGMALLFLHYLGMLKNSIPVGVQVVIASSVLGATVSAFITLIKVLRK
jgi:hypothetical protein